MIDAYKLTRAEIHSGRYDVRNVVSGEIGSERGEHSLNLEIAHRASIRRALREGKQVPASVLADYPYDNFAVLGTMGFKPDDSSGDVSA